jgi:acyl carrier protein
MLAPISQPHGIIVLGNFIPWKSWVCAQRRTNMDVETAVKEFIERSFQYRKGTNTISKEESLLDSGLIDSAGILEVVNFIESQFSIGVLDEDIVPENFETIGHIVAFIQAKQKGSQG